MNQDQGGCARERRGKGGVGAVKKRVCAITHERVLSSEATAQKTPRVVLKKTSDKQVHAHKMLGSYVYVWAHIDRSDVMRI